MSLEKNTEIINREFSALSDQQLSYHIHVHNCSIAEILDHLARVQKQKIGRIEKYLDNLEKTDLQAEYKPGRLSGYILRLAPSMNCKPGKVKNFPCKGILSGLLVDQNRKLETLIRLSTGYNIHKRIIRCGFMNVFRISMADHFEITVKCQQKHLVMARRILMLQNL